MAGGIRALRRRGAIPCIGRLRRGGARRMPGEFCWPSIASPSVRCAFALTGTQLHFGERADDVSGSIGGDRSAGDLQLSLLSRHSRAAHDLRGHLPTARRHLRAVRERIDNGRAVVDAGLRGIAARAVSGNCATNSGSCSRTRVAAQIRDRRVGCFLSGGTDSSTVAGMLGQVTGKPPASFSIGFEAEGYDEMEYARIAAKHFNDRASRVLRDAGRSGAEHSDDRRGL